MDVVCKGNYKMGDFLSGYEGGEYNYKYKTKTKKPCYVRFIDACMTRAAKTNAIIPVKNLELIFLVDGLERE